MNTLSSKNANWEVGFDAGKRELPVAALAIPDPCSEPLRPFTTQCSKKDPDPFGKPLGFLNEKNEILSQWEKLMSNLMKS